MTHYKGFSRIRSVTLFSALALGLAACGSGGESENEAGTGATDSAGTPAASAGEIRYTAETIENGVAYGDLIMGSADAPVEIIEYFSLTCGHCATFHQTTLPTIKERYVATGQVRFVLRNLVRDPYDLLAGMIARCAGPERAFPIMDMFFARQRDWLNENAYTELQTLASRAGVSRSAFETCTQNKNLEQQLLSMAEAGRDEMNVTATPTFFINGERIEGALPVEDFEEIIRDNL